MMAYWALNAERWFQHPSSRYPEGTIVCPFCGLPETTGEYDEECQCWNDAPDCARQRTLAQARGEQ